MNEPLEPLIHFDDNGQIIGVIDQEAAIWAARRLSAQLVGCAGKDPKIIRHVVENNIQDLSDINMIITMFHSVQQLTSVIGELLGDPNDKLSTQKRMQYVNGLIGVGGNDNTAAAPTADDESTS